MIGIVVRRWASVLVLLGALGISFADLGSAAVAEHQSFLINESTVTIAEAPNETGLHTSFSVGCPVVTEPTFLGESGSSACTDGNMLIYVSPATAYYKDGASGYATSTYDATVSAGATLRVGGKYTQADSGVLELHATYIWNTGAGVQNPPANPMPSTLQDFNFSRKFLIDGTVKQVGMQLTWAGPWGSEWGFVVGQIPDPAGYYGDTHVRSIAAAHRDPGTLDPQLKITTTPLTIFYVERCTPTCNYYSVSKDEAVNPDPVTGLPAQVRVGGSYGWSPEGDWRFVASYVWRPAPAIANGRILFGQQSALSSSTPSGSSTNAVYNGLVSTGTQLNPGSMAMNSTWTFNIGSGKWDVIGTWTATRSDGLGSASGTFSGTWTAATGALNTVATMTSGTGRFAGYTGSGTFNGVNAGLQGPPQTLAGDFNIAVTQ